MKYIFIIGLIIYYIFIKPSAKKQEAAKQRRPQQGKDAKSPQRTFEDLIREFTNPSPASQQAEPVWEEEDEHEDYNQRHEEQKVVSESIVSSEKVVEEKVKAKVPFLRVETVEEENDFDFDLRQAIINDAILNRPFAD